ncbi:dihydrofolate reductase family protein [Phytohabitans rumicis]|uniref:Deaminase n=1 Tax=Phytohabitans rumicis TaxID=1076125 RepID=A0A6V8L402_9ACTN|nr:dihydrofolate reductase family protein [Phytohabitans rumicis]GFJ90270.1 deaminase [Phytohabitans rumicis]
MTKITTGATMSLDGYIADANHGGFEYLFQWYTAGDVEVPTGFPDMTFRVSPASAKHLHELQEQLGVLVCGRRLYDITNGWGGRHPMDKPVVVLSHSVPEGKPQEDENFVFVSAGIHAAIDKAKQIAGGKDVGVNGGTIAQQCLDAGLLDEVAVDLVPVILGSGIPFFGQLENAPVQLEGPISVVEGIGVTHLNYKVVPKK